MLNGAWPVQFISSVLTRPVSGSSNSIQPNTAATVGYMNDTQNRNSKPRANGMLVRASTQAISTPIGKVMSWRTTATSTVFLSAVQTPGWLKASRQACRP